LKYGFHSDTLRQLRREKGMTQVELADLLGVSRESVKAWETDRRVPGPARVRDLASALGVSTAVLVAPKARLLPADLREKQGLSVSDLARLLQVDEALILAAEDGETLPDEVNEWSSALHVFPFQLAESWVQAALTRPLRLAKRVAAGQAEAEVVDEYLSETPHVDLRTIRELTGLTGTEVGERLGLHSSSVYRVEAGQLLPARPDDWAAAYKTTRPELTKAWLAVAAQNAADRPAIAF